MARLHEEGQPMGDGARGSGGGRGRARGGEPRVSGPVQFPASGKLARREMTSPGLRTSRSTPLSGNESQNDARKTVQPGHPCLNSLPTIGGGTSLGPPSLLSIRQKEITMIILATTLVAIKYPPIGAALLAGAIILAPSVAQ